MNILYLQAEVTHVHTVYNLCVCMCVADFFVYDTKIAVKYSKTLEPD